MNTDHVSSHESVRVGASISDHDKIFIPYHTETVCSKWDEDAVDFARRKLGYSPLADVSSAELTKIIGRPQEILVVQGNLLLNEGLQRLRDLAAGLGGTAWNTANAYIGVGDSTTAEAASQTELQAATNRFYKLILGTYPQAAGQGATWSADYASGEANFAWQEWTVAAGANTGTSPPTGTTNLNRKVASLGTKVTGVWNLAVTVTFS